MTNYLSIFKTKVTYELKENIFKALESLGYRLIIKEAKVGPKLDTNIWVAQNGDNIILYHSGCFTKKNSLEDEYFTIDEYNIIREVK